MAFKTYGCVAEIAHGETAWSITFPEFPGVTSVAERHEDLVSQAHDALASAIEDRIEHGEALPPALEDGAIPVLPATGPEGAERWMFTLVRVETKGPAVRVQISLESSLLSRIDDAARRRGQTRSALLSDGARRVLAD